MAGRTDLECVQEASIGYFTYEGAWGPCSDDFEVEGDQSNEDSSEGTVKSKDTDCPASSIN